VTNLDGGAITSDAGGLLLGSADIPDASPPASPTTAIAI